MKKPLLMMLIGLIAGFAAAAQTPQPEAQIVDKAKSVAIANGVNLGEFRKPDVSRTDDGKWLVHFQHVQRYQGKRPVYPTDDCFFVFLDGKTKEATFSPCP